MEDFHTGRSHASCHSRIILFHSTTKRTYMICITRVILIKRISGFICLFVIMLLFGLDIFYSARNS